MSRPSRLHMTGEASGQSPSLLCFPQLPPVFMISGARILWRGVSASFVLVWLLMKESWALRKLTQGDFHFEVTGRLRVCPFRLLELTPGEPRCESTWLKGCKCGIGDWGPLYLCLPCSGDWWLCTASKSQTSDLTRAKLALGILGIQVCKYSQIEESILVLLKSLEASVGCILLLGLLHSFISLRVHEWMIIYYE